MHNVVVEKNPVLTAATLAQLRWSSAVETPAPQRSEHCGALEHLPEHEAPNTLPRTSWRHHACTLWGWLWFDLREGVHVHFGTERWRKRSESKHWGNDQFIGWSISWCRLLMHCVDEMFGTNRVSWKLQQIHSIIMRMYGYKKQFRTERSDPHELSFMVNMCKAALLDSKSPDAQRQGETLKNDTVGSGQGITNGSSLQLPWR